MKQKREYYSRYRDQLVEELAREAGITPKQASRVLEVLRIDVLEQNFEGMQKVLQDSTLSSAIGYVPARAADVAKQLEMERFNLKNIGLSYYNPNLLLQAIDV